MRTIIDLPEEQVAALDRIGQSEDLSRAELVRRAVSLYLEETKKKKADLVGQYYGFLNDCPEAFDGLDGVEYQRKIRSEWDHRDQMYSGWALQDGSGDQYAHRDKDGK